MVNIHLWVASHNAKYSQTNTRKGWWCSVVQWEKCGIRVMGEASDRDAAEERCWDNLVLELTKRVEAQHNGQV